MRGENPQDPAPFLRVACTRGDHDSPIVTTFIGDVHGWAERLDRVLDQAEGPLVFVGDLIDRGPSTPRVLTRVRQLCDAGRAQVILGNHEWQLVRALGLPGQEGDEDAFTVWAETWGGAAVLKAYDVETADDLRRALGDTLDWLAALPWVLEGRVGERRWIAVHAGLEDGPLRPQLEALRGGWDWYGDERPLPLFSKRHLHSTPRDLPKGTTLVSGHTPVTTPLVSEQRILCDTSGGLPGRSLTGVIWPEGRIIRG